MSRKSNRLKRRLEIERQQAQSRVRKAETVAENLKRKLRYENREPPRHSHRANLNTHVMVGGPRGHERIEFDPYILARGIVELPDIPRVNVNFSNDSSVATLPMTTRHLYRRETLVNGSESLTYWRHDSLTGFSAMLEVLGHYAAKPKPCNRCGYKDRQDD